MGTCTSPHKGTEGVFLLHTTSNMKQELMSLIYARSFENAVKEGLKWATTWAAHYFTNKSHPTPYQQML